MITQRALQEFKDLWLKEYGTPLNDEEATEKASALLTLFDQIYKPLRKDWIDSTNLNLKK